ncbi:uncharacterized protein N7511_001700 [Penicillium nucicola]|uniref:uncharacterized protein n=1 Tax=Penicillium nucicola TaxID=1850975 RepID=UPI00254557AB|nr:uncharacterized protein N7511_001700 [Penicillium nucicola]KAJ5776689.1 hypothetical protein N7511_001700 [Penicillium nucicola]
MHINFLALVWGYIIPIVLTLPSLDSLFQIKANTDSDGGFCSQLPDPLGKWLSESGTLVNAGLQALSGVKNPSASENKVAKDYLWSYFNMSPDDTDAMNLVQKLLEWTDYNSQHSIPILQRQRSDVAKDVNGNDIFEYDSTASDHLSPVSIENIPSYQEMPWTVQKNGRSVRNNQVPYWSDDMRQYLFDISYRGKTYCTVSNSHLGATQHETTPSSITLYKAGETLGDKEPAKGLSITDIFPRSGTFYHELFHLTIGNEQTPDITSTYSWTEQQKYLKTPDRIPSGYDENYQTLIRRNPETYVWFGVGYWYFQQTQWTSTNQRWSFHSGAGELLQLKLSEKDRGTEFSESWV